MKFGIRGLGLLYEQNGFQGYSFSIFNGSSDSEFSVERIWGWQKRRGKLRIKLLTFYLSEQRFLAGFSLDAVDLVPEICVEVMNHGKNTRYVGSVVFKTLFPVDGHRYYQIFRTNPRAHAKLPYRLDPGEKL